MMFNMNCSAINLSYSVTQTWIFGISSEFNELFNFWLFCSASILLMKIKFIDLAFKPALSSA